MKNKFVVIEWLDWVWKTTCAKGLAEALSGEYLYNPPEIIRPIRKEIDSLWNYNTRFLYYFMWNTIISDIVREKLQKTNVVLDRYLASTICYHKALWVRNAEEIAEKLNFVKPTIEIILTCDRNVRQQRLNNRNDIKVSLDIWLENIEYENSVLQDFRNRKNGIFLDNTRKTVNETINKILNLINS